MNKLLASIQYVMHHPDHVKIDPVEIDRFVDNFHPFEKNHWLAACPFNYSALPRTEDEIDRWFLSDSLAFCFWGNPHKWTVEYQHQRFDGWWALLASIQRALDSKIQLLEGNYLANLSFEDAHTLFEGTPEIPLFNERVEALHNLGHTLQTKYQGRFHHYLAHAPTGAIEFVEDLAHKFSIFDDVSIYKGEQVYFYKKAQLLVHDLTTAFSDSPLVRFTGARELTGEADYKIPAYLRDLGILNYSKALTKLVDNRTYVPADSPMEVEIRAAMLWAIHLICEKLSKRGIEIDPLDLDAMLWIESQTKDPYARPYHLTLTTDY